MAIDLLETQELGRNILSTLQVGRPLKVIAEGLVSASTAELYECTSEFFPSDYPLVLKLARPGFNSQLKAETLVLKRLEDDRVPHVIQLIAAGRINSRGNRWGIVEKRAEGKPVNARRSTIVYTIPTEDKVTIIDQYLEFLIAAAKSGYAKKDHQAEGIFWNRERVTLVDFTGKLSESLEELESDLDNFTLPQLPAFLREVFGCSIPGETPATFLYSVDLDQVMPGVILDFHNGLQDKGGLTYLFSLRKQFATIRDSLKDRDYEPVESFRKSLLVELGERKEK